MSDSLNTRIEVFDCVLKLKGRLSLLSAQVAETSSVPCGSRISSQAAAVQYIESDDEDAAHAANILCLSGTEAGSSEEESEDAGGGPAAGDRTGDSECE